MELLDSFYVRFFTTLCTRSVQQCKLPLGTGAETTDAMQLLMSRSTPQRDLKNVNDHSTVIAVPKRP
ncbi:hypothetical protein OUZ56_001620 [Daphnia magna]|uniref:Uncharacterized protein n=1 Tax=Daphnia magna TaxID=35525 RepID=A0ABR0A384_9CRUS|nr:hypothetical protein OUZ56_001620 [Daphnia magna]